MSLIVFRKTRQKLKSNIVLDMKKRIERFGQINIEGTRHYYPRIRKNAKRLAIFEVTIQYIDSVSANLLFLVLAIFAITIPFFLSFRLGITKPLSTAVIYFIPSSAISFIIYLLMSYGSFRNISSVTKLPLEDEISIAFKWVFISAIVSGISTVLFSPLLTYIIITPFIVGVGAATLFLVYDISLTYLFNYFSTNFQKKYPIASITDLFLELLEGFGNRHSDRRSESLFYKNYVAQLLGETSEVMQKVLPRYFVRVETSSFISEITDPYINKLIERRVAEMAMTLKFYASMILLSNKNDKNTIEYVEKKLTNIFLAILKDDWKKYEIEDSGEITMLADLPPLSKKISKTFDKLRLVTIGMLPAGGLLLIQNTKYALSDDVVENILPFILTWALISVLSLIGSEEIIDKALKAKSVLGFLERPIK